MKDSRKGVMLRSLTDYFLEKGEIMDKHTYVKQSDIPVSPRSVRKIIGNWSRLPKMIKVNYPEDYDAILKGPVEEELKEEPKEVIKPKVLVKPKYTKPIAKAKTDEK